jgi:PhnB protein
MPTPKVPPVSPYLTVRGGKAAIDFYKKAFGAKVGMLMMAEDKQRVMHASLVLANGGTLMLSDAFDEFGDAGGTKPPPEAGGASVTVHLECRPDVDSAWKKAVRAGAEIVMPLADMFWGDRFGKLRDPFGHVWSMSAPVRKKPAATKKAAKKKKR